MSRGRSGQGPQAANRRHGGRRSLPAEIGRTPHRDRSSSAPRSVALRVEIGPLPARDRSHSASRSVALRVEIGRTPHRVQDAQRRRLEVPPQGLRARKEHSATKHRQCVPPSSRSFRGREPEDENTRDQREPFLRPAAVNVRSASHSPLGSVDSDGSDGTAHGRKIPSKSDSRFSLRFQGFSRRVNTSHHIPMCTEGVCAHMGVGTTALTRISFRAIPRFLSAQIADECATLSVLSVQRLKLPASCSPIETGAFKTAHAPRRMAARARQHSDRRAAQAEMPRNREVPRTREERGARPAPNRSRRGLRPISARKWTDLEAEYDRSRRQGRQGRRDYQCPSGPGRCAKGLATG